LGSPVAGEITGNTVRQITNDKAASGLSQDGLLPVSENRLLSGHVPIVFNADRLDSDERAGLPKESIIFNLDIRAPCASSGPITPLFRTRR